MQAVSNSPKTPRWPLGRFISRHEIKSRLEFENSVVLYDTGHSNSRVACGFETTFGSDALAEQSRLQREASKHSTRAGPGSLAREKTPPSASFFGRDGGQVTRGLTGVTGLGSGLVGCLPSDSMHGGVYWMSSLLARLATRNSAQSRAEPQQRSGR